MDDHSEAQDRERHVAEKISQWCPIRRVAFPVKELHLEGYHKAAPVVRTRELSSYKQGARKVCGRNCKCLKSVIASWEEESNT